jgi:hypothetical protein
VLLGFVSVKTNAQVTFSKSEYEFNPSSCRNIVFLSTPDMEITFPLKYSIKATNQDNYMFVDEQVMQMQLLEFDGFEKDISNADNQKLLLENYSKEKIKHFEKEWSIDTITPNIKWIESKDNWWYIFHFQNNNVPMMLARDREIQVFAVTVIDDKILMINAPMTTGDDFTKGGFLVNHLMESLEINK